MCTLFSQLFRVRMVLSRWTFYKKCFFRWGTKKMLYIQNWWTIPLKGLLPIWIYTPSDAKLSLILLLFLNRKCVLIWIFFLQRSRQYCCDLYLYLIRTSELLVGAKFIYFYLYSKSRKRSGAIGRVKVRCRSGAFVG